MAVMLLPGLGEAEPPPVVRAGLALAITVLLVPAVAPLVPAVPEAGLQGAAMVAAELLVGALLGWMARLPVLALGMAGAVVSYMLGLSSVVQQDPALGGQSAALSRLFGLAAPVLILSTGLYALPLSALAGSYQLIPPGSVMPSGPLADSVTGAVAASFGLAIRLSAPFLLAGLVFQVALGLLARLVPQLQVYSAAIPGQILAGLVLLGVLAAGILGAWNEAVATAWSSLPGL
ncbi:MAG: flagellar biosynthetic protein FliR [Gemmatimonadaceae bacterium]|nr:flagellar biosynthetic protein FliR [Acetobacteraceae bacterium]